MDISPDAIVFWRWGPVSLNATILFTWLVMAVLACLSWLVTRNLSAHPPLSRGQNVLEVVVSTIRAQIREINQDEPDPYLSFVGTLFLFIAVSNSLAIIPGYHPPTGSLSTTAALAACVFIAIPLYGVARQGFVGYFRNYVKPSPIMLPFNIIGELSRTLALAVRLFGNVMSGSLIAGILLMVVPLFFPILMHTFSLLVGLVQAYIFAVLAMVYIASATRAHREEKEGDPSTGKEN